MKKIRCMIAGTDWWDDCDDAAALRILAWAHCRGDIRLLGVALNACSPLSAPSLDAFLQGEGLHGIPIGLDIGPTGSAKKALRFTGGCWPLQRKRWILWKSDFLKYWRVFWLQSRTVIRG